MNPGTGQIHRMEEFGKTEFAKKVKEEKLIPLTDAQAEALERVPQRMRMSHMRNEPCPCGSGTKFKKCCIGNYK